MDMFPEKTASSGCPLSQVVDYFDGNTVTALRNYAQQFAMSDNSFNTTFGPSSLGAVNLISGQTHGVIASLGNISGDVVDGTLIGDADPLYDDCGSPDQVGLGGKNIGDLLNAKNIAWGWLEGGFSDCNQSHTTSNGGVRKDHIPHHQPFQYYLSTANPHHLPPSSVALIGHQGDQANHQYDIPDFWNAAHAGNLPAVSFIKAPAYQDGNAGYSNPLLEQQFVVDFVNRLQAFPDWQTTAVVLAWDDSGGWYDHVMSPIINQSQTARDSLTGVGLCGSNPNKIAGGYQARCGYGTRLPFLLVSPWAKQNVDHGVTDQTSIIRFIEDNWQTGRIGDSSFDALAGDIQAMFDFHREDLAPRLIPNDRKRCASRVRWLSRIRGKGVLPQCRTSFDSACPVCAVSLTRLAVARAIENTSFNRSYRFISATSLASATLALERLSPMQKKNKSQLALALRKKLLVRFARALE
jgi:phospholipase C